MISAAPAAPPQKSASAAATKTRRKRRISDKRSLIAGELQDASWPSSYGVTRRRCQAGAAASTTPRSIVRKSGSAANRNRREPAANGIRRMLAGSINRRSSGLFDDPLRPHQDGLRDREAECFCCVQIDDQIKMLRLLHRNLARR